VDPWVTVLFVATHEGRLAGTCHANDRGDGWELDGAFVSPGKRGKGIFSAIMKQVKSEARSRGIGKLVVLPDRDAPDYWKPALDRWGFTPVEDMLIYTT
jgi:N-acetylglutamate synthase-like GNAT family acetyltransferase